MIYEWDEAKRQSNQERHKVDFVDVLPLFVKVDSIHLQDTRRDYGEDRFILLGQINGRLFQVAYTIRGSATRII